jgi:hypothetical protein
MHRWSPRALRHALLLLALSLCCGCGSKFADITGKVTLAGTPVSKGTITFLPGDGHGPTVAEKISEGQFSVRIPPGQYKVQIYGFRKLGEQHANKSDPSSPMKDILEQIIPARYNTATTLTREIKPGQRQEDFLLD